MSQREDRGTDAGVIAEARTQKKVKRPPLYKVLFHNDDYTTKEFVVAVLQLIFGRSEVEATAIMLQVHNHGMGVAGIYPFEVAETKVAEATSAAEEAEFPLLVTMEAEDRGSE